MESENRQRTWAEIKALENDARPAKIYLTVQR